MVVVPANSISGLLGSSKRLGMSLVRIRDVGVRAMRPRSPCGCFDKVEELLLGNRSDQDISSNYELILDSEAKVRHRVLFARGGNETQGEHLKKVYTKLSTRPHIQSFLICWIRRDR
ncbi:hypothetical protein N7G274_006766 [Stereocaulon virgatum]|uniref:Uncharacterized protein n=1 Tax=Stereocaulon virgatum TaxID=373712 RepID=A0ABR4A5I3_9LECA